MPKYTLAILVKNESGVLNRITGVFYPRQYNITSLSVSETESDKYSRITITYSGEEGSDEQVIKNLLKLSVVYNVKKLKDDDSINCELMLIKVKNSPENREDIRTAADAFKAETVDYTHDSVIMKITGDSRRIEAFIALMNEFTILEICRTGIVSMERGSETVSQ